MNPIRMTIAGTALLSLGACQTTGGILGTGVTPDEVLAALNTTCQLTAPIAEIATAITANPTIVTAQAFADALCKAALPVLAAGTQQSLLARPLTAAPSSVTVILGGVPVELTKAAS